MDGQDEIEKIKIIFQSYESWIKTIFNRLPLRHLFLERLGDPFDSLGDRILVRAGKTEPEVVMVLPIQIEEFPGEIDHLFLHRGFDEPLMVD